MNINNAAHDGIKLIWTCFLFNFPNKFIFSTKLCSQSVFFFFRKLIKHVNISYEFVPTIKMVPSLKIHHLVVELEMEMESMDKSKCKRLKNDIVCIKRAQNGD